MIRRLFVQVVEIISSPSTPETSTEDREAAIRMATAVLMIDVARADHVFEESEFDSVLNLVELHFDLTPEETAELVNDAGNKAEDLVSLHEFTQLLHKHLNEDEKARIIALLWKVPMPTVGSINTRTHSYSRSAICCTSAAVALRG